MDLTSNKVFSQKPYFVFSRKKKHRKKKLSNVRPYVKPFNASTMPFFAKINTFSKSQKSLCLRKLSK